MRPKGKKREKELVSKVNKKLQRRAGVYRLNNIVNQLLGLVDLVLGISHDQAMQVLFLVARVSCVRSAFALLHGALATDCNLGTRLSLHFLQSIATRANK